MTAYSKYDWMENYLQEINREHIALEEHEIHRNNIILDEVRNTIIKKLQNQSKLFCTLYADTFFGGSYYDGLKVGQPNEYDLDLPLRLHKTFKFVVENDNLEPGFVKVILEDLQSLNFHYPELEEKYRGLEEFYDDNKQLDAVKVLKWLQRIVDKALKCYLIDNECLPTAKGPFRIKKSIGPFSPACTFKINSLDNQIQIDIDLVPCFVFEEQWPNGYKTKYNVQKDFFIVPKHPGSSRKTHYWRLSFQRQERALLKGKERLKSALKLMKKLRDTQQQDKISSYFLKTIVLLEIEQNPDNYWNTKSLSYCFMKLLEAYRDRLEKKRIPYFWYEKYNLIAKIDDDTLTNFHNRIANIIIGIQKNSNNPNVMKKYIIKENERCTPLNPVVAQSSHEDRFGTLNSNDPQSSRVERDESLQNTSDSGNATTAIGLVIGLGIVSLGVLGATIYERFRNLRRRDNN